ncbi:2-hydroxyacid dehydrogenase [Propionicicella superfundia]|uniref:2-hydroxyacid dehydrogenase n=1 Tax=Propionicicella superfundia TaxID=348582 RepID=UPI001FE1AB57|nr:2-hydroxyacid dehydrogenase [Propionicicella superfundia]
MVKVLLAGDGFVTSAILRAALARHVPDAETAELTGPWPDTPLTDVEDVREAAGDRDELIAALQGVTVAFSHTHGFTRTVIENAPDLRMIVICRGGPVNVSIPAATEHGVLVTRTPGRNATATTEHTIAMILAAVRQVSQRDAELKAGIWRGDLYRYDLVGPEVRGKTVGLVGYGAVGSRVAAILQAMGATVAVYDPFLSPGQVAEGVELVGSLDDLLGRAAILSIHARETPDNYHMIGAAQIARMPEGSILVNCARGGLLDYDALCDALDSEHLYAAACDVLPSEPLPEGSRLLTTRNLTMTPHLGGGSKQAAELAAEIGAADIARFLGRVPTLHAVNPEVEGL